ncbi:MAG: response regulator [Clostridia bacterium]|nr:response regulator [Clostridia bacterium]
MKKVLIADDEFLVRLGLKTTIDWEENGFLIVGEAKNGKEAVELFEKFYPDILLTDIRMPVIDGLELIQILKEKKSTLKAVILSHYDDFNYAREAIKLGASEYILKSDLSSENLLAVLRKLSSELDSSAESLRLNKTDDLPHNNEEFLERLLEKITDGSVNSKQDLNSCIGKYEHLFRYDSFAFIYGVMEDIQSTSPDRGEELFDRNIRNIAEQVFEGKELICKLSIHKNIVTGMVNLPGSACKEDTIESLHNTCLVLKKYIKQFLDIEISIGMSDISPSKDRLLDLFQQAKAAHRYCFFEESGIVDFREEMLIKKGSCPGINLEILTRYVKTREANKINLYIDEVFDELFRLKQVEYVKDVFIDFLSYAKIIAKELNLKNGPALSEIKFSYSNFDNLYSFHAVKKYLMDIFCTMVDYTGESKSNSYSFIINKSVEFVKQNYHKNIALADAAEYVEISKSYLSLLFKQETGINFTAFLTNYRVEMAKKLLISSNHKIYEIAEKVGFENPYYFSKVFRDIAGMTCKDYKKNYYLKQSYDSDFT